MDDRDVLAHIGELVAKEHRLEQRHAGEGLDPQEAKQLRRLEVDLDQCWDLLRQRRARRAAGLDPEDAQLRAESTVEGYLQ
ncbi:MAG: DUF2630 family protein [Actinomycetota bacterium]